MFQTTNSSLIPSKLTTLLTLFLLIPTIGFAEHPHQNTADKIINKATEMLLWEKTEWLNLLHYNKEFSGYSSQVDDERFFYAAYGNKNPQAELKETLKHLFKRTDNDNNQTQCKFVARSEWLSKQLDIDKSLLPSVRCDEYLEWRELTQADSVTMIFPAYHLNSPSSMFGHTLLRLDNSKNPQSEWLSFAVNFGADINNDDNSLIYAYRGLAGGYPGIFITEPYFKKIQEYNRIEHRDIWEYRLNLSPEETRIMINHLWELKTINFDYYFFDENCSYRLLELIEVARPSVELTDEFIVTAIPVDTVRSIEDAQLIESVSYRPARATRIQFVLAGMSKQEREIVLQLSKDIKILNSDAFTSLTVKQQKTAIDLAYKYLRYQKTKQARDSASAKRSHQLLQTLNDYPVDINISDEIPTPIAPEKGHKSKRTSIGLGQRLNNNYAEFGFKMAFHDLEDNKDGFLQGAQINIGTIKIRVEENVGLRLYQMEFVDIFSLTPRNEFFSPLSWKVNTGFERQQTKGVEQLAYHLTGGGGGSWKFLGDNQFYTLATGRLEINKQLDHTVEPGLGFITGSLSHFGWSTARFELSGEHFTGNMYRLRATYTHNFVINTNNSLKIFTKYEWQENNVEFSEINLAYQYYF